MNNLYVREAKIIIKPKIKKLANGFMNMLSLWMVVLALLLRVGTGMDLFNFLKKLRKVDL